MGIIKEEQILQLINDISDQVQDLQTNIELFQKHVDDIQIVIDALECYYRTTGGNEVLKKISDIEFDNLGLQNIMQSLRQLDCQYSKKEIILDFNSQNLKNSH